MRFQCSSASRKFLNDSVSLYWVGEEKVSVLFSEPKIPQFRWKGAKNGLLFGFSALQRAENSSMFLLVAASHTHKRFSALQRAENSSISCSPRLTRKVRRVSVLFSEPKIPQ